MADILSNVREVLTTNHASVTVDNTYKYAYRYGNIVYIKAKITVSEDIDASGGTQNLLSTSYKPFINSPFLTILNSESPYTEASKAYVFVGTSVNSIRIYHTTLPAGTYFITGSYICE